MIYRMARDIAETLEARFYPVSVYYGPERVTRSHDSRSMRIVFERDREQGDVVREMHGFQRSPRVPCVRDLGVIATLAARSNVAGARVNEHEHECDALVDALTIAIAEWFVAARTGNTLLVNEARYLQPEEHTDPVCAALAGVQYRMRFRVPRAVRGVDYEGQAEATATLHDVETTTTVVLPDTLPETVLDDVPTPPETP